MTYWHWLVGLSLAFVLLERLRPARRDQPVLRPQLGNDLFYLAFNGHFYSLVVGGTVGALSLSLRDLLEPWVPFAREGTVLGALHPAVQFVIYLLLSDFLQWCVHNLLHRVPLLWQFHKVHHSVHQMDWIASFRFHWVEIVVYSSLLWLPLSMLGGSSTPLFAAAVFGTMWGHFNHSNVDLGLGPLGYLFNSPRMHLWHHDASDEGGTAKNFGIVLSVWDWIFGTAYWPRDRAPGRIGYPADVEMPRSVPAQLVFPLVRRGTD